MRSSVAAVNSATGMEISPNVRVPLQTLCGALSLPPMVGRRVGGLEAGDFAIGFSWVDKCEL